MQAPGEQQSRSWSNAAIGKLWIFASIGLAALLLAWPSFVNRGPFFIADTTAYLRSADAAFSSILTYDSIWSDRRELYTPPSGAEAGPAELQNAPAQAPTRPPLIGRSIYYGAFIYAPVLSFGEQAGVLLQAALAAIVVWLALVPIRLARRRSQFSAYFGAIGVLALATSLPFTATLLVPDYLTGLACAALVLLLCFWDDFGWGEIVILAGVIGLAALSHSSNLPLLLALSLVALAARMKLRLSAKAALIGIAAVALGVAGEALFVSAVEKKTGMTPIRPPFLTARLIADGPGHKLLRARCSVEAFEVCRYTDRTPHDSDLFLWSEGTDGVFSIADFASQRRLSEQDMAFAIATFREYPLLTVASSGKAFVKQLGLHDLRIWHGDAGSEPFYDLSDLPDPVAARMAGTLSVQGQMPVALSQSAIVLATAASLLVALWCIVIAWRSKDKRVQALGVALVLVALAILMNAAVTGAISKPDSRYNLRIIWVLPLFAYLSALHLYLKANAD